MLTFDHHHHLLPPPLLVTAGPRRYRTLCDLPVELLSMIISYLPDGIMLPTILRSCTLACRCIRPVALPHHFRETLFLHHITSFDHALSFLQANPKVCEKITRLKLKGEIRETSQDRYSATTPLDDAMVARLLQLLPNVERLDVWFFIYAPPTPEASDSATHVDLRPRRLRSCHIQFADWQTDECDSSVSGLFRILSLFPSIQELKIRNGASKFGTSPLLDPTVLHRRSVQVRSISMREDVARDLDALGSTLKLVNAFKASTEPGLLGALDVRCSSAEEVAAVGELIAHARGALKRLEVGAEVLRSISRPTDWEDPLDDHWQELNLASCPKLDTLEVHVHFRGHSGDPAVSQPRQDEVASQQDEDDGSQLDEDEDVPQPQQGEDVLRPSLAAIGMLSQVSRSVRDITIRLHGLPAPRATVELLKAGRLLGLQAFDEVITLEAFPLVGKVYLHMHFESTYRPMQISDWREIQQVVWSRTLPNLEREGLLDFGLKVKEYYLNYGFRWF